MPAAADPLSEPQGPRLFVRLLDAPEWQRAGHPAPHRLTPKDAALLAKLALDGPQSRVALCELLWPGSGPSQSADSLRQRASRLRSVAGVPLLQVGATVELHPAVAVDAAAPESLSDQQLIDARGLLAGVDLGDHDELDRWLARARTRIAERCAQVLADRAEALERGGRLHEALPLAGAVVRWVPLAEQGWRRLMRLHYLRGDPAAAQDVYWQLNALLRDELGARPSPETQALYQTVETAQLLQPAQPRRPVPVSLLRPPIVVGRNAPWAAMAAAWRAAQSFVVIGEGGLGKSRLLEAFAHGRPGLVAERARPGDGQLSNAVLARLLWAIEQRFAPAAGDALRAELARLEPRFGAAPAAPGNEAVIRHAVERWLADAAGQGLRALVVDDLHNVDRGSLEMLRWLAASPTLAALRFGFASRPWPEDGEGASLTAWLADSMRPVPVTLEPWSRQELVELLATLALPVTLDERVVARLHRHAGGHPFYTLATLQHAVAHDVQLRDPLAFQPPESVHRLLDARLRGLPADARGVLQLAAVGGADLSVERAARILGCAPLELSERWATLEANDVLRGEAFSHDLVHDAALRCVPQGIRQALHRQWAALLEGEAGAPPARVAWHWEQGLRPAAAAQAWRRAALTARRSGLLAEQAEQFEHAARCHLEADEPVARCDALLDRLDGLHLWRGAAAVLAAVAEVEPLATTSLQRLRCGVEKTEALIEQGLADQAVRQARAALAATAQHPAFDVEVRAQLAKALAQSGHADPALAQATLAMDAARAGGAPLPTLKAANALMYVHWSAGRLADAVGVQREELAMAEALGDRAVAAASEGSLAALLAAVGDVPGTYRHAREAHRRQLECGLSSSSVSFVLNHVVRGAAAAAFGFFDEALELLQQAVAMAGGACPAPVEAKARLSLGGVLLVLGDATAAGQMAATVPAGIGPGMQMQSCWLRARAAELAGASADADWARFDDLHETHAGLPFGQDATFEASWRGRAEVAIERLARARRDCLSLGLTGAARALQWRELARWLDLPGEAAAAAALACARDLEPHATDGLNAKCYPPAVLLDIARACERADPAASAGACRARARRWIEAALARVPDERKPSFLTGNPVNRALW